MSKKKHSESHESEIDLSPEEKPLEPGTYYGELSELGQWFWRGTGAEDDSWVQVGTEQEHPSVEPQWVPTVGDREELVPTPLAASAAFYIAVTMTYPPGASQIGQASSYQIITPWGQSTACIDLQDAFNQLVSSGSQYSGQMGNYLNNGVTRGLTTTSATVPTGASYFQALP